MDMIDKKSLFMTSLSSITLITYIFPEHFGQSVGPLHRFSGSTWPSFSVFSG